MELNIIKAIAEGNQNIVLQITAAELIAVINEVYKQETERTQKAIAESFDQPTISQADVKKILNVSDSMLWRWERDEYLIPVRVGRKKYYRQSDIERLVG